MAALYDGNGDRIFRLDYRKNSDAGIAGNSGGSMITYRYDAYGNTTKSNNFRYIDF